MHRARLGIFFCLRQLLGIGTDAIDLVPSVGGRICQETPILRVFEKTTRAGVKVWDKAIFVSVLGMEKVISISPQVDILLEIDNLENIFEGGSR